MLILGGIIVCLAILLVTASLRSRKLTKEFAAFRETHNESYSKFLSESRNQAYQYIEELQSGLFKFKDRVEPQLKYFNTYGKLSPSPHIIIVEEIDSAYRELAAFLPEDNNKEKK
jgi:hypothetical protein